MQDKPPKPADTTIRSRIAQLALLACCTLVGLVVILGWTIERTREANDRVQHTVSIRRALAEYTREVVGAESGQRGYLLTHQDVYLASYNQVLGENKALFARLSDLIGIFRSDRSSNAWVRSSTTNSRNSNERSNWRGPEI